MPSFRFRYSACCNSFLRSPVRFTWTPDDGTYKLYENYYKEIAGDNIGYRFCYDDLAEGEQITVQIGVSFVSVENAWENLEAEQRGKDFDKIHAQAVERWNSDLGPLKRRERTK